MLPSEQNRKNILNADFRKSNTDTRRFCQRNNLRLSACNLQESALKNYFLGGFTLVELLITIVVVGIVSIATATLIIYLVQIFLYVPIELKVHQVAEDILNTIIEGEENKRGLRFTSDITTAEDNRIIFTNSDGNSVDFNWDSIQKRLTRQVDGGTIETVPYYIGEVLVSGSSNIIFKYYDSSENLLSSPVSSQDIGSIKRIRLEIIVERPSASTLTPYIKVASSVATSLNK